MTELGTDSVVLLNTREIICQDCGERSLEIPNYNAVMRQVTEQLCLLGRLLNGGEFLTLRLALGISGQACAKAMGVTNVTVSRWENNASPISAPADRLIRTWTLGNLGYQTTKVVELLGSLPEGGIGSVAIDLSHFRGPGFRYESCQRFGGAGESRAWMMVNIDVR